MNIGTYQQKRAQAVHKNIFPIKDPTRFMLQLTRFKLQLTQDVKTMTMLSKE